MRDSSRILVVGSGAYVIGDRYGPGVVLRSVATWLAQNQRPNASIMVTYRKPNQMSVIERAVRSAIAEIGPKIQCGVISASEIERLLRDKPLALFVCVPDRFHAEYVELGTRYDVPVWLVKPVTGDVTTAQQLEALCRQCKAAVWVDYHKRFDISNQLLRQIVATEQYGRPLHYFVQYSQPRDLPLQQFAWAADSDPLTYLGSHYLDQLGFVFPGVIPKRTMAISIGGLVRDGLGERVPDQVICEVLLEHRGKSLIASLHVGWGNPLGSPSKSFQRVELDCERGKIRADQTSRGFEVWSDERLTELNPYFFQRPSDPITGLANVSGYGFESVAQFLAYCVAAPDVQEGLRASQTLPWLENVTFAERILTPARCSWQSRNSAWVDIEMS